MIDYCHCYHNKWLPNEIDLDPEEVNENFSSWSGNSSIRSMMSFLFYEVRHYCPQCGSELVEEEQEEGIKEVSIL